MGCDGGSLPLYLVVTKPLLGLESTFICTFDCSNEKQIHGVWIGCVEVLGGVTQNNCAFPFLAYCWIGFL